MQEEGLTKRESARENTSELRQVGLVAGGTFGGAVAVIGGIEGVRAVGPEVLHTLAMAASTPEGMAGTTGVAVGLVAGAIARAASAPHRHWDYQPFDHPTHITSKTKRINGRDKQLCVHPMPDKRVALTRLTVPAATMATTAGVMGAVMEVVHVEPTAGVVLLTGAAALGGATLGANAVARQWRRGKAAKAAEAARPTLAE